MYSTSIKIVLLIEQYFSRLLGSLRCTSCSNMHISTVSVHIIAKHIYIAINFKALNLDWRVAVSTCVCMYVLDHRKQ